MQKLLSRARASPEEREESGGGEREYSGARAGAESVREPGERGKPSRMEPPRVYRDAPTTITILRTSTPRTGNAGSPLHGSKQGFGGTGILPT